ncbi:mucin-5AC-like [Lucilia sericata]|uniref:mucin-5AC-like n=1 Tax=Lucilia sericata TaxID=13632 RepID=UPI0018A84734|nr:mucin-5AC-like [Lucilia sericata]
MPQGADNTNTDIHHNNNNKADAGLSDNTSPTHFQALTNAQPQQQQQQQQSRTIVTNKKTSSPKTLPATYCTSTRSAAVMALALRSQTPPSPQTTHKNSRNYRTAEAVNHSAESTFTTTTSMSPTTTATTSRQHINNRSPAQQIKSKILNERPNGIGDLYSGGSSSSDNDGVNTSSSSSATALRRLYFKSGRSTKTKANTNKSSMSMTQITKNAICTAAVLYHSSVEGTLGAAGNTSNSKSVPKVVVMGSSTASASDTIINTSTDSASTMITNVTHTDTSETCDSLDLVECVSGDNSGQSEPLFSSLEEPLLTAIQVDSEQEGTEIELTSCSSYSRPDMNLQESTESQESCLSILTGEPSSTTPLLSSHRKHSPISTGYGDKERERERVPNTAPAPTSGGKHFTFDKPQSPKSQQQQQQQRLSKYMDEGQTYDKCNSSNERLPTRTYPSQKSNNTTGVTNADVTLFNSSKKSRNETAERNRYSMAATATHKTSPKRERRRSPSSSTSKVNSAPPTMKDSNFFGSNSSPTRLNNKQLSPTSQSSGQRKYSSSSSSGGSERYKDGILFPFDREAIDYERIQRECFALKEHSSSSTTTSDSDEPEPCSVYERSKATISPKPTEFYKQYSLLSQKEQQQQQHSQTSSRKNSKRLRSDSLAQKYIPKSDAFSPKSKTSSPTHNAHHSPNSQIELNKFEDIASKFDQMPPKHGSIVNLATKTTSPLSSCGQISNLKNNNNNYMSNNNIESISSNASSPSNSRSTTPPLPNLRVDFFMEKSTQSRKKSFKNKPKTASAIEEVDTITTANTAHDFLGDCQYVVGSSNVSAAANVVINSGGPINVTANPMEVAAVCTQPRATIVVQQFNAQNTILYT